MNKANLTALLKAVKAMIMRERVAYRDYLGEETVTRMLISGTLPDGNGLLTLEDATFTGFVVGETYQVTIDGQTMDRVAALWNEVIVVSVGDINSGNAAIVGFVSGNAVGGSAGEYVGKSITVSQTKTTKRYRTKKLPTELLPDGLAKSADVSKVAAAARNAQTTAEAAQTTAETAKTTANNIVLAAVSRGVENVKTITDIGAISGLIANKIEYKAKGLNIKVNSTVTLTSRDFGSGSMRWDGHRAVFYLRLATGQIGPTITLDYQVDTDTYILRTTEQLAVTVEKMEYTEVPVSEPGTFALPYLQFSHILLYSNSGKGKLFKITVNDSGVISATEVAE